jgi:putative transcriptional regulator
MMAKNEFFEGIRDAMLEGIDALKTGRPLVTRTVVLPDPPEPMTAKQITRLRRQKLGMSQSVFAGVLNTATQTVQAWEQGRNRPSGAALRLLRLVERRPEVVKDVLSGSDANGRRPKCRPGRKRGQ